MNGGRPTDPDLLALASELEAAGLLTIGTDASGAQTWTLTREGTRAERLVAMGQDEGRGVLQALVAQLAAAGLLTTGIDDDGRETWSLTPEGARMERLLATSHEQGQAVLDALLDATEADALRR
jgi:hypothetical protein